MEPLFDYEKLDVYRVELAFIAWIAPGDQRCVDFHEHICCHILVFFRNFVSEAAPLNPLQER